MFRINRAWSRDAAVGGNIARFINHACRPNCWFEVAGTTIWIRASRRIETGEELTYDYATVGDHTIKCRCRPRLPDLAVAARGAPPADNSRRAASRPAALRLGHIQAVFSLGAPGPPGRIAHLGATRDLHLGRLGASVPRFTPGHQDSGRSGST